MRKSLGALLVLAGLFGTFVAPAFGESREADAVTLGALTRFADLVVVAEAPEQPDRVEGERAWWTLRIRDVIRGDSVSELVVVQTPSLPGTIRPTGEHLLFLTRVSSDEFVLRDDTFGARDLGPQGTAALLDYVRAYAPLVDAEGRAVDRAALAAHLVDALVSDHAGLPYAAGRDLLHHEEVYAEFDDEQRARIAAALRTDRKPDRDAAGLAVAAGRIGGDDVVDALVDRLRAGDWRPQRAALTDAIGRLGTPRVLLALTRGIGRLEAPVRRDIGSAIGKLGLRDGSRTLIALLRDEDAGVQAEACHALGRLARAVRRPDVDLAEPAADEEVERRPLIEVRPHLATVVRESKDDTVRRAALWALAQIDHADAWDELRRLRDDGDDVVRRWAEHYLARPRVELVLDR